MLSTGWVACLGLALSAASALAQAVPAEPSGLNEPPRISATWAGVPIADVLRAFSDFSGKTIVTGENVTGSVTADIKEQPWDVALRAIRSAQGLIAVEDEHGIIRVNNIGDLNAREAVEPIVTRVYRISFSRASELQATIAPPALSSG
jgi:type IV pilus assembly protein PilQ